MNVDGLETVVRDYLPNSFSEHHQLLVKICFGCEKPDATKIVPMASERRLTLDDTRNRLYFMVLVEFYSSLLKELEGSDDTQPSTRPNPYDVFLVESTMDQPTKHLAVCFPIRRSRQLGWYDGGTTLIPMDDLSTKWRVASLSGPARVLIALSETPTQLTRFAIERNNIIPAVEDDSRILSTSSVSRFDQALVDQIHALNSSQKKALATMLDPRFQEGFFAIHGPPGCGKTSLLSVSISCIGKNILVLAPSNAAVANIALSVYKTGRFRMDEISVFGENTDPTAQFLNPKKRGDTFVELMVAIEKETNPHKREELIRDFTQWLQLGDEAVDFSLSEIASLCPHYNMESSTGRIEFGQHLAQSKVVFSTLNSAGSSILIRRLAVDTIMLDEAGQTPEAEFFIATQFPIMGNRIGRLIIVGDPLQLPATVICQECKHAGYGRSWLEKVYVAQPELVHLLNTQYRMHPKILQFPNRQFYQNQIVSGDSVHSREPYVATPFRFIDTCRRGREERERFSWINTYEAVVISSLLHNDSDIQRLVKDPKPTRIIVISPYKAQAKLLRQKLDCPRFCSLHAETVDSFQGQEADIVMLSTVRTNKIGFVDDRQRLNVALTRAKRVLRVVGDASLFRTFNPRSTLRSLCEHAEKIMELEPTQVRQVAWARPNWNEKTLWKSVVSSRFLDCLKQMSTGNQNICLNTLHAVAMPDIQVIGPRLPLRDRASWYISFLKEYGQQLRIVWIAKEGAQQQIIEAHFAGTPNECMRFVQKNTERVPPSARVVEPTLMGLVRKSNDSDENDSMSLAMNEPFISWPITNATQKAICDRTELPQGGVQLDRCQELVVRATPPLIIESRSGTGKTLALLQHAASHADPSDQRAACFVTVSPRLRRQLQTKYNELNEASIIELPPTTFYSFPDLIHQLTKYAGVKNEFDGKGKCTFLTFAESKSSHKALSMDPHLVENEIGGVIMGSVDAAIQGAPLARNQYLDTKRSNISNKTDDGLVQRNLVFDQYERYAEWKRRELKFDRNDVVLRLLQRRIPVIFSAAYLDETQDFSYAAIALVCQIAGKNSARWVFAGDTAQMVSPGCSFTFAGLKDTLLAIRPGIESKLSNETQLLVNYRTTKDVLILGNEILSVARREFPGAIGYARPESAVKDLGIKVVLCDWDECFAQTGIKLGRNQALIYSCQDTEAFEDSARAWIGSHPFIISSLDSKGLEFDDVIVAFDLADKKTWKVDSKKVATLRMLRELYVAVTRAQRRVVILVRKSEHTMRKFFSDTLEYEFQCTGGDLIRMEFDQEATAAMWLEKGMELFEDEQFVMASRCFDSASAVGWSAYARGRHLHAIQGNQSNSVVEAYHEAFSEFFKAGDFQLALDLALLLTKFGNWHFEDNRKIDLAIKSCPDYLDRNDVVRLNILCDHWDDIGCEDLKEDFLSDILPLYRTHSRLIRLVQLASDLDRFEMEATIPVVIGDYYCGAGLVDSAVRLYLQALDVVSATQSTSKILKQVQTIGEGQAALSNCVDHWNRSLLKPPDSTISLLAQLYKAPETVAKTKANDCLMLLGRTIIVECFDHRQLDRTLLYDFSASEFLVEVTEALKLRFAKTPVEIVRWFVSRSNMSQAVVISKNKLSKWTVKEILSIALILGTPLDWMVREIVRRKITGLHMLTLVGSIAIWERKRLGFVNKFKSDKLRIPETDRALVNLFLLLMSSENRNDAGTLSTVEQSLRRHPWTDQSVIKMAQSVRSVAQILQTVDQEACIEFPTPFAPIFRQAARNSDMLVELFTSAAQKDQAWLLRALLAYEIDVENRVKGDLAESFLQIALKAQEYELALKYSWKTMGNPNQSQRMKWVEVASHWDAEEHHCAWLRNRFPGHGDAFTWQIILLDHPRSVSEQTSHVRHIVSFGSATTRYLTMNRNKAHDPSLLQTLVNHEAELRVNLRKILEGHTHNAHQPSNNNTKKRNRNKKKKKGANK